MSPGRVEDPGGTGDRSLLDWVSQIRDGAIALAICVALGAGLALVATRSQEREYRATGTFVASPASGFLDPSHADAIPAITANLGRLAETSTVLAETNRRWAAAAPDAATREQRRRTATTQWLREHLSVRQVGQSAITEISATAPSPAAAAQLSDAALRSVAAVVAARRRADVRRAGFRGARAARQAGITVAVLPNIEGKGKVSPTPARNLIIGINVGLIIGVLAALVLGGRRRRLREPEAVAAEVGVPLLGTVPVSSRRSPEDAPGLAAARARLQSMKPWNEGLVVVVTGTSDSRDIARVARGLLWSLGAAHSAVLVDADLKDQRASRMLNVSDRAGLSNMLERNGSLAHEMTVEISGLHNGRLSDIAVLPAGPAPSGERNLAGSRLVDVFAELRGSFDFVVVAGPSLSRLADVIWLTSAADCALIVAAAGVPARRLRAARFVGDAADRPVAGALITRSGVLPR